jgi:hypothetical protein
MELGGRVLDRININQLLYGKREWPTQWPLAHTFSCVRGATAGAATRRWYGWRAWALAGDTVPAHGRTGMTGMTGVAKEYDDVLDNNLIILTQGA